MHAKLATKSDFYYITVLDYLLLKTRITNRNGEKKKDVIKTSVNNNQKLMQKISSIVY